MKLPVGCGERLDLLFRSHDFDACRGALRVVQLNWCAASLGPLADTGKMRSRRVAGKGQICC